MNITPTSNTRNSFYTIKSTNSCKGNFVRGGGGVKKEGEKMTRETGCNYSYLTFKIMNSAEHGTFENTSETTLLVRREKIQLKKIVILLNYNILIGKYNILCN